MDFSGEGIAVAEGGKPVELLACQGDALSLEEEAEPVAGDDGREPPEFAVMSNPVAAASGDECQAFHRQRTPARHEKAGCHRKSVRSRRPCAELDFQKIEMEFCRVPCQLEDGGTPQAVEEVCAKPAVEDKMAFGVLCMPDQEVDDLL